MSASVTICGGSLSQIACGGGNAMKGDFEGSVDSSMLRGWFSPAAWKRAWSRRWTQPSNDVRDQEEKLAKMFMRVAQRSAKEWQRSPASCEEARLESWVRALEEHLAFCRTIQCVEDEAHREVARMLAMSKRSLRQVQTKRMMRAVKKRWQKKQRARAANNLVARSVPKDQEPVVRGEALKEEEEFELGPNLAEELKRWGEFKTGPGASSSQEGIDELTAFVQKRQAKTDAAASKDRSFHNERMQSDPLPTGNHVGENGAAE